ncbi:MAG: nucleotidyltransferase [Candidatus Cloacimonetes bacterium]|nr:nucleotidyltransferase [Candidatus Cloacimonadota bacterium]
MIDQFTEFIKVLKAFDEQNVEYILIGGVAVILLGMERLTRDIDIFERAY